MAQQKLLEPEKATAEDVKTRLGAEPVGGGLRFHNVHVWEDQVRFAAVMAKSSKVGGSNDKINKINGSDGEIK